MGQVLHGSVRTTEAVRRAMQHSQESLRALAKRYGVNQKTIAKWKKLAAVPQEQFERELAKQERPRQAAPFAPRAPRTATVRA